MSEVQSHPDQTSRPDPIPCFRPDYDPRADYEAELAYRHEMYPDEIDNPFSFRESLSSALATGRDMISKIRDARDDLYGYNDKSGKAGGKGGFAGTGIHLKPVEEMEFLPGGFGGTLDNGKDSPFALPGFGPAEPDRHQGKTVIIREIHKEVHHHGSQKKKTKKKGGARKGENLMDPGYIPKSLKDMF